MSVHLGELTARADNVGPIDVTASNYDSDRIELVQDGDYIVIDERQMMLLSNVIDRFMENK